MRICDDLRQAVLQAAIQGKLTDQFPEDGDAANLLKQISAEKAKLIKEGKIQKGKPLPVISPDEIPFDIPDNWKWVRLSDLIYLTSGNQYIETKSGSLYVKVAQMNLPENKDEITTSDKLVSRNNKGAIPTYSIIFPKRGGAISTNKKRKVLKEPIFVDSNIMSMTCIISDIFNFVYMWFSFIDLGKLQTGTSIPQINNKDLYPLLFPLPPLEEQHRIVAKVDELMTQIDDLEKTETELENLKATFPGDMKAALLQAAVQGKLTKQLLEDGDAADLLKQIVKEKNQLIKEGKVKKEKPLPEIAADEVPFDIPDNWVWCRIGHVLSMQAGKNTAASSIFDSKDDEYKYPCYGGNGIRGYKNEYNREGFHAIVGRQGALCGNVNFAEGKFYATEHAVVVDCYANMDMSCVGLFLKALNLNQYATSTAQPGISVAKIINTPFPLPPLAEQKRIVEKLDKLLPLCDGLIEE